MSRTCNSHIAGTPALLWPHELTGTDEYYPDWQQPGSNLCLDIHGDPTRADLVVFSDGNHHMALRDCLDRFARQHPELSGIFYATTPPGPIVTLLKRGGLRLGNLVLTVKPHVFISPPQVLEDLAAEGLLGPHVPFVRNQGSVLLVRKGNPKRIHAPSDLMREDIRLFLSNPEKEKISYTLYCETLQNLLAEAAPGVSFPDDKIVQGQMVFGNRIHHREAPQVLAQGRADAALLFYHLALRFVRIFPDLFDLVPLGGSVSAPAPWPGNLTAITHLALVGDGGAWGTQCIAWLKSSEALACYANHGLLPA